MSALLGIVVGTTLGPQVNALARYRVPRILSGLLVYLAGAGIVVAFLAYAIPELTNEVTELGDRLDEFRADYEESANVARLPEWEELQPWVEERLHVIAAQLASQAGGRERGRVHLTVFVAVSSGRCHAVRRRSCSCPSSARSSRSARGPSSTRWGCSER